MDIQEFVKSTIEQVREAVYGEALNTPEMKYDVTHEGINFDLAVTTSENAESSKSVTGKGNARVYVVNADIGGEGKKLTQASRESTSRIRFTVSVDKIVRPSRPISHM